MVSDWLQRLGLAGVGADAALSLPAPPAPAATDPAPRWLDRVGARVAAPTAIDGCANDGRIRGMTADEMRAACDWLNNPRGWRRVRG